MMTASGVEGAGAGAMITASGVEGAGAEATSREESALTSAKSIIKSEGNGPGAGA